VSRSTLFGLLNSDLAGRFYDVNLRKDCWDLETVCLLASHADYMKLNEEELNIIAEHVCTDEKTYLEKARKMIELFRLKELYVTFGAKGAAYITSENELMSGNYPVDNLQDTVGAGDAFSSVIIKNILKGADRQKALESAAYYASKVCTIRGALTEDIKFYEEIKEEINAIR